MNLKTYWLKVMFRISILYQNLNSVAKGQIYFWSAPELPQLPPRSVEDIPNVCFDCHSISHLFGGNGNCRELYKHIGSVIKVLSGYRMNPFFNKRQTLLLFRQSFFWEISLQVLNKYCYVSKKVLNNISSERGYFERSDTLHLLSITQIIDKSVNPFRVFFKFMIKINNWFISFWKYWMT